MAQPDKGFFSDFGAKLGAIWKWITDMADEILLDINLILTIKQIISRDFASIVDDFREITKDFEDFADRVKHLRAHVIRADRVFELIDEIRTGKLRDFCVTVLHDLESSWSNDFQTILDQGQAVGVLKTGQLGSTNPIVKLFDDTLVAFGRILSFVKALESLRAAVQEIRDKLESFEDIILPQTSPRHYVDGRHQTRIP